MVPGCNPGIGGMYNLPGDLNVQSKWKKKQKQKQTSVIERLLYNIKKFFTVIRICVEC